MQYDPSKVEDIENKVFADDLSDFDEEYDDEEYDTVYDLDKEKRPEDDEEEDVELEHEDDDDIETGSGFLKLFATDDYDIYHDQR